MEQSTWQEIVKEDEKADHEWVICVWKCVRKDDQWSERMSSESDEYWDVNVYRGRHKRQQPRQPRNHDRTGHLSSWVSGQ